MEDNKIKAIFIQVHKKPEVVNIENTLRSLQQHVDGYIEFYPMENGVNLVLNEEGKINGMKGNRLVGNEIICGDFLVVGDDGMGETVSLNDIQIQKYMKQFREPMEFTPEQVQENLYIKVMDYDKYLNKGFNDPRPKVEPKPYREER